MTGLYNYFCASSFVQHRKLTPDGAASLFAAVFTLDPQTPCRAPRTRFFHVRATQFQAAQ